MKNAKVIFAALLIASAGLLYSSCQKDHMNLNPASNSNSSARSAADEAYIDHQSTYIDGIVQAVTGDKSIFGSIITLPQCATVTYDTSGTIKTATIDFGSTPCLTNHEENQYRQGILVITWTGNMLDSGTVKSITTQNYLVGDTTTAMHQFNFTKTITNLGLNSSGNLHFAIVVSNATLTLDSGQVITWNANRFHEWFRDISTPQNDFFLITGMSYGTDRNRLPFATEITSPLKKEMSCEWVVSGTKVVTHGSNPARIINYGDGSCDNIATVTVNGQMVIIHFDKDE